MKLNWGAVALAAIVHWLFGAVWFTVFKQQWTAGLRMEPDELQMYMAHPNFWPYLIALLCNLLMAYVIARMLMRGPTQNLYRGITVGLMLGILAAAALVTELVFEARAGLFIGIAAGYPLIGCVLMGIILGVWKPKTAAAIEEHSAVS